MEALVHQGKGLVLILVKQTFLHYNADHSYLFVNEKEIFKFKADSKNATLQLSFVSKSYLMDLVLLSLEKYL